MQATSHTIPSDFPLADFVGQVVSHLSFLPGQIRLFFYPTFDTSSHEQPTVDRIYIESGFEFESPEHKKLRVEHNELTVQGGCLTRLLGQQILGIRALPRNELALSFTKEMEVLLIAADYGLSSYQLYLKDTSLTVTKYGAA